MVSRSQTHIPLILNQLIMELVWGNSSADPAGPKARESQPAKSCPTLPAQLGDILIVQKQGLETTTEFQQNPQKKGKQ